MVISPRTPRVPGIQPCARLQVAKEEGGKTGFLPWEFTPTQILSIGKRVLPTKWVELGSSLV